MGALSKQDARELEEAIYLLFVKSSTLPVWLAKNKPKPEATGTTVVSTLGIDVLEKEGKQLAEIMFQVDVYCSKAEGISMEEIEYIDHMLKEAYKDSLEVNGFRLSEYNLRQIEDRRNAYKMAPEGFERVMGWGTLLMSRELP